MAEANAMTETSQHHRNTASEAQHWSRLSERGTARGMLFLHWVHRIFGRGVFNILLYPVACYFLLFSGVARKASLDFLRSHARAYPQYWSHRPGYRDVFQHFYTFGQSILDKLLAWGSPMDESEFDIANEPQLAEFMAKENGQLIIGSHLGNLEYCRGFVQRYKQKTINALVYDQHSANFVQVMQQLYPASRIHIYQVSDLDIPLILNLKSKIDAGEWLFIAGDRIPLSGEARTVPVTFLQRQAQLPIGPYMLAKVLQCEVQLMFSYRKQQKVYFELVPFAERINLPRQNADAAVQAYAQQYATALEAQCARAPLQWFNFYPYWSDANAKAAQQDVRS
jgi:predicted LPLAT superfamily acyltransferase